MHIEPPCSSLWSGVVECRGSTAVGKGWMLATSRNLPAQHEWHSCLYRDDALSCKISVSHISLFLGKHITMQPSSNNGLQPNN
eukprot:1155916-Pelagomonas_calceolata.AAC.14